MNNNTSRAYFALAIFSGVALLHLWGALDPSLANWGFNHWALSPGWLIALATGITVALIGTLYIVVAPRQVAFTEIDYSSRKNSIPSITVGIPVSTALFAILYLMRSQALCYGDGYSVIAHIDTPDMPEIFSQYRLQIGAIYFQWLWKSAVGAISGVGVAEAFSYANLAGGALGLWATYLIARVATNTRAGLLIVFFGALTSGSVILFFGHIEHYTLPYSVGLWSLYYLIKSSSDKASYSVAVALSILALALHLIAAPFLVITLLSGLRRWVKQFGITVSKFHTVSALVGASIIFVAIYNTLELPNAFTPFGKNSLNSYSAFSLEHLRDQVNLLIFMTPLAPLIVLFLFPNKETLPSETSEHEDNLLFVGVSFLIAAFWIDPTIGAPRDWDLLCFAGIPLSIYIALRLMRTFAVDQNLFIMLPALIFIAVLHIAPNIYEKANNERAMLHLNSMLKNDPHYTSSYDLARRAEVWGVLLLEKLNRIDLAEMYFVRSASSGAFAPGAWRQLGEIAFKKANFDSSTYCFVESLTDDPNQAGILMRLAQSQTALGHFDPALGNIRLAEELDPGFAMLYSTEGVILSRIGRFGEALAPFRKALNLEPNSFRDKQLIGMTFLELSAWDSAYFYLESCVIDQPNRKELYDGLITAALRLKRKKTTQRLLDKMKTLGFTADYLARYREELDALENGQ